MPLNTNISRLMAEGILNPEADLSADDVAVLESLSEAEVTTVIAVKAKLGAHFFNKHAVPKADFIF